MQDTSITGIDLSNRSFEFHGATEEGTPVFRKRLSRGRLLAFLQEQSSCRVVMEACGGADYWGREMRALGHECALIPPIYVKPFRKRQKNDANDATAIVEAAQRPTMRFVAVKSEEAQAQAAVFHTRRLLVRQRTQLVNALHGRILPPANSASVASSRWGSGTCAVRWCWAQRNSGMTNRDCQEKAEQAIRRDVPGRTDRLSGA